MSATPFAYPLVVADIGGTNARFATVATPGAPLRVLPALATAHYFGPAEALEAALGSERPRSLLMAVAGPVGATRTEMTNAGWVVEPQKLLQRFSLGSVTVLNDFEALALALPQLGPGDLRAIGGPLPPGDGTKLVLGPGTGLGAAALIEVDGRWRPVPSEAGHITLAPQDDTDRALWPHVADAHGRVDAERLVSGPGLMTLHRGLAAAAGKAARFTDPSEITEAALTGDAEASALVARFCLHLGRFAGDLALAFLPAGVYIGGGIAPRILKQLEEGPFRAAFAAKPPFAAMLERLPTAVITHEYPAIAGLAALAANPEHYAMNLTARRFVPD